jgi:hypothetical protein
MADDDTGLVIGVVLGLAALAALGAFHHGSSTSRSSSTHTTTSATHSASTAALTTTTTVPTCTRVVTVKSSSGASYTQYPISSAGSSHCYLKRGNTGLPVAALQRGLGLCMGQKLVADGVYGPITGNAVARVGRTGTIYGPVTAGRMSWPWFSSTTTKFNGHCAPL